MFEKCQSVQKQFDLNITNVNSLYCLLTIYYLPIGFGIYIVLYLHPAAFSAMKLLKICHFTVFYIFVQHVVLPPYSSRVSKFNREKKFLSCASLDQLVVSSFH